jgi:hypothetical protein
MGDWLKNTFGAPCVCVCKWVQKTNRFDMITTSRNFSITFLALLLAGCSGSPPLVLTPSPVRLDDEQEAVYVALLQNLYSSSNFVIMDTTATGPGGVGDTAANLDSVLQNMHGVDSDTVDNFRVRNNAAHPVSPHMDLGTPYTLLTQDQMNQLFNQNQDGWQLFYEQYPGAPGITTISQVGFNLTFDQALVYVGTMSHWLAGAGYFVLLEKVNGTWVVDQRVMSWIS